MKENGKQTSVVGRDLRYLPMGVHMKVNTFKIKCKDQENMFGLGEKSTKGSGTIISSMGLEHGLIKKATLM